MKNINVLPADSYTVINRSIITEKDKQIVSMLYQPIMGYAATSLYYTLVSEVVENEIISEDKTHHHLMSRMQLRLDDILIARQKLEAMGLLKTYLKKDSVNQFVYMLYSPLEASEFFNHPILNIVLYNNLGKTEYEKVLNTFKFPRISLKDYEDITSSFNDVFSSVSGTVVAKEENYIEKKTNQIEVKGDIDFDLLISSISIANSSQKLFTDEIKTLIDELSYIYHINTLDMQGLIKASINEKGSIDKNELRKNCRDFYKFDNGGNLPTLIYNRQPEFLRKPEGDSSKRAKMIYTFENISPYQLLKAKYRGAEPTDRDKRIIENLMIDQKLNPGVVNVLISYVLKTNNEQLKKNLVETIAGQWKRSNIETVEEAMIIAEKEHKKMKKMMNQKTEKVNNSIKKEKVDLPAWFNKDQQVMETTKEEEEELDKILDELI